ncbi:type II toxin-antitoxin system VapB family antitoxin [Kribbella caucasensis]|nr:type II toxin-antitoxin system VapB family antitoxin [Kribbella sp. VKM Ac-2527]
MALSIKTDEADRLARELAAETHESLTEAITVALRERLDRVRAQRRPGLVIKVERLAREYSAQPVADRRSPDELLGYDESGLPS